MCVCVCLSVCLFYLTITLTNYFLFVTKIFFQQYKAKLYERQKFCFLLVVTTRRPPDLCEETQTAVVWSYLAFIRSGQIHLARYSERGKKARQTEEEVGRQHQGMDRSGVRQVPEGSGEQGKKRRKLVAKSSVVPQRPSRLRDR